MAAVAITADAMSPRFGLVGESLAKNIFVSFVLFTTVMAAIWLLTLLLALLVASGNLLRKGAVGPKRFDISADALSEKDGHRTTVVPWRQVRSIDKTRRYIFVRIGPWKYVQPSARDFPNEYRFAQYYADLVKAKHEST